MPPIRSNHGFTLIELLIVVAIVAVLATFVLLAINPTKIIENSRRATAEAAMNQIAKAAQMYEAETGILPPDESRNIPTVFMGHLGAGPWPEGPWPGSKYDWDNWEGQTCWDGTQGSIQISVRDIKTYQGKLYSTQEVPVTGRPQFALYFAIRGVGIPHCSSASTVGICVNCQNTHPPTP